MPDPLNPKLSDEEFVALILRQYPSLTREQVLEEAKAYGFDLMVPESSPSTRRQGTSDKP